jgi:hypothetical protein
MVAPNGPQEIHPPDDTEQTESDQGGAVCWTHTCVAAILTNARYTGHQGLEPAEFASPPVTIDSLGSDAHEYGRRRVQRWNPPDE